VDPKAHLAPNMTPYHYSHNNPVNRIDPDGQRDMTDEEYQIVSKTLTDAHLKLARTVGNAFLSDDPVYAPRSTGHGREFPIHQEGLDIINYKSERWTPKGIARIAQKWFSLGIWEGNINDSECEWRDDGTINITTTIEDKTIVSILFPEFDVGFTNDYKNIRFPTEGIEKHGEYKITYYNNDGQRLGYWMVSGSQLNEIYNQMNEVANERNQEEEE
jgi:hypothetical protein